MTSYNVELGTSWVQISDNEDYILQNVSTVIGNTTAMEVLVKASDSEPTSTSASLVLSYRDVISSNVLNGVIWARSADNTVTATVSYAK
jgi:hypothetical protein